MGATTRDTKSKTRTREQFLRQPFTMIPHALLMIPSAELSFTDKLVIVALRAWAGFDKNRKPITTHVKVSERNLAWSLGCGRNVVAECLDRLIERGIIEPVGGAKATGNYYLHIDAYVSNWTSRESSTVRRSDSNWTSRESRTGHPGSPDVYPSGHPDGPQSTTKNIRKTESAGFALNDGGLNHGLPTRVPSAALQQRLEYLEQRWPGSSTRLLTAWPASLTSADFAELIVARFGNVAQILAALEAWSPGIEAADLRIETVSETTEELPF
jgi:hypothetical protein